ncbi:MAG: hypothetical protein B5M56_08220 [Desulfococcus sp. 4484_241]|nr:MAG: hypothetical protein B5M56_08220 [Desulfococcus sp. 4484_241]
MLQYMRERASSIMIKGILALIILAFIFLGIGNFRNRQNATAAIVNGERITAREYQDSYQRLLNIYRRQFGDAVDRIIDKLNLKQQAMDRLIANRLILQKARQLGIVVSEEELARSISSMPVFQNNGRFDKSLYTRILQSNRMTPASFEYQHKLDLLAEKLRRLITDNVMVSEEEARQWYDWQNTEVKIKTAIFKSDVYTDVNPSDSDIAEYFEQHKERYKTPEKRKMEYVRVAPDKYIDKVDVTDDEIKDFYYDHNDRYTKEKTVRARHILIKVDKDADEKTVEEKHKQALKIYDMIVNGQKDFAKMAEKYSEGPSAKDGGLLGTFKKDDMVAQFSEKAFSMKEGDVSKPVRTQFGWHIIKVEKINEASVIPLSRVMETVAKSRNLAVVSTDFFTRTDTLKGIENGDELVKKAFELEEGDISDVIELAGEYYVFQVVKVLPPSVPELAAVKERVLADLKKELQTKRAEAEAVVTLDKIKSGATLEDACKGTKATVVTTGFFKRFGAIPGIGMEPELVKAAFTLSKNKAVPDDVVKGKSGYYLPVFQERRLPPDEDFKEKKDMIIKNLLMRKKNEVFMAWIADARAKSEIKIEDGYI